MIIKNFRLKIIEALFIKILNKHNNKEITAQLVLQDLQKFQYRKKVKATRKSILKIFRDKEQQKQFIKTECSQEQFLIKHLLKNVKFILWELQIKVLQKKEIN